MNVNERWSDNGITIAGGNGRGNRLNQLCSPYGIYVDDDYTVYVADYSNHRIVEWKHDARSGRVVAGGNGEGDKSNQLNSPTDVILDKERSNLIICDHGNRRVVLWPRENGTQGRTIISDVNCWGLVMDSDGYLYVSDQTKHDVKRWRIGDTAGTVVAGGNRPGNRLSQLHTPRNICIDQDHSLYISDNENNRVMKWSRGAKQGIVIAGEQDQGNHRTGLSSPNGVIVDHLGNVYIADFNNRRVIRWCPTTSQSSIVIDGKNKQPTELVDPAGLSFDRQGNLYVVDHVNSRVRKFNIDFSSNS
jgi:sugar lactone lactonase YvrE